MGSARKRRSSAAYELVGKHDKLPVESRLIVAQYPRSPKKKWANILILSVIGFLV